MAKLFSLARQVAFVLGLLVVALAVMEEFAQLLGHSLVRYTYTPGRLLEFATMLMVFVIAFELRAAGRLKP